MDYLYIFHGPDAIEEGDEQDVSLNAYRGNDRRHYLEAWINETRALTIEGLRAKARVIVTDDLELRNNEAESTIASLLNDLAGDYDPVAIAKGEQPAPAVSAAAADTPILELGRRCVAAQKRMTPYDSPHGELHETVPKDYARLLNGAANDEVWALTKVMCNIPALTLQDVAVQLDAAFLLADGMHSSDNGLTRDESLKANFDRIRRALASATRVIMSRPGVVAPGTVDGTPEYRFRLAWKGEMPPVRLT